ncbi:myosin heavy chain 9/10/11/14 [Nematocida sp. AWRm80]|nr:myosin heavy chain 9/10/11/14 [Nematocida sp. AWRm80]
MNKDTVEGHVECIGKEKHVWWLTEEGEYELGRVLSESDLTMSVEVGNKTMDVGKRIVHKANPSKFDLVENMSHLSYLNEPSILHNLRQRYLIEQQYTYSGLFLVAINPYKHLGVYGKDSIDKYSTVHKREDASPHIYAVASEAYYMMRNSKTPQTILITGESGAGKTENTKHAIEFLTKVSGNTQRTVKTLEERLLWTNPLLEAFGNAQTQRNDNSSRFGKFIKIEFGINGEIIGARVERYLLESTRVTKQSEGEKNYHIFHTLLKDTDQDYLSTLHLEKNRKYKIIPEEEPRQSLETARQKTEHSSIITAMHIFEISNENIEKIFQIVAAIIHLGETEFEQQGTEVNISRATEPFLQRAAEFLGVEYDLFKETLLRPKIKAGNEIVVHGRTPKEVSFTVTSLCKVIYERLFDWIVFLINQALKPTTKPWSYIGVLDIAGFEILESNGFEQLCINYTNEKLQQFFNHRMFILEQETYLKEGLDWDMIDFGLDLQPTIDLLETASKGIFSILDEECVVPGGTDKRLLSKVMQQWKTHDKFTVPKFEDGFIIDHYAGQVKYNSPGWITKNKDPLDEAIAELLLGPRGSMAYLSSKSLSATRFRTIAQTHKQQLQDLLQTLYSTNPHFVRCINPNSEKQPGVFDSSKVLNQLRCNGVLEGVRISRQGFPTRVEFREFVQRYLLLSKDKSTPIHPTSKGVTQLLAQLEVPSSLYRLGKTRLFLRQGALADLEELRNLKISSTVKELQKKLRELLSANLERIQKEKDEAIALLQKNVKIFASVRKWAWWKLCMKVRPLLEVRKSEDELKERDQQIYQQKAEIHVLTEKIRAAEIERSIALEELQKILSELEQLRQISSIEKDALQTAKDQLTKELNTSQRAATKSLSTIDSLKKELAEVKVQAEQAKKEAATESSAKLLTEISALKFSLERLEKENSALKKTLQETQTQLDLALHDKEIFQCEKTAMEEKAKKYLLDLEEAQNETKTSDSLRYKAEMSLKSVTADLERVRAALEFEKEKSSKLDEAFKRATAPIIEQVITPPQPAPKNTLATDIERLKKELEAEKEVSAARKQEFEELKKQHIDLMDHKLESMLSNQKDLNSEITKLRQTNTKLQINLSQAEEAIQDLQHELKDTNAQKTAETEKRKKAEQALSQQKQLEQELQRALATLTSEKQALNDKLLSETGTLKASADKCMRAQNAIVNELEHTIETIEEVKQLIEKLFKEIAVSTQVVQLYREKINTLTHTLLLAKQEEHRLKSDLSKAKEEVLEAESALEWATKQLSQHSKEKEQLVEELEAELHLQREKTEEEEHEWMQLKKKLDQEKKALQKQLKDKEREVSTLLLAQQEAQQLQKKLATQKEEYHKRSEAKAHEIQTLQAQIAELAHHSRQAKEELAHHQRKLAQTEEKLRRTESTLEHQKTKALQQTTQLQRAEETHLELRASQQELQLEISKLTTDLAASKLLQLLE